MCDVYMTQLHNMLGKLFELLVMQLHDTMALCMVMVEGRVVNSKSICSR
jgi:hypothetical protein